MLVSILRVEQPNGGYGPYAPEYLEQLQAMFDDHGFGDHPGPADDPQLGYISESEHCGFATVEQLDDWFEGYHEALHGLGFVMAQYLVPIERVRYGKTQAVFLRGDYFPVVTYTLI